MKPWYFSECPYPFLPPADSYESIRVSLPNENCDPDIAADLYDRYFEEWLAAEAAGLNIMVNEHHQTATCLNPCLSLPAAALARMTSTARIILLGYPIANRRDPIRVAEEIAVLDTYSRGRIEVGFVKGVPSEIAPANSNPVDTGDRLWEALDLIEKALSTHDGPFNWESEHYNYRQVNIWPREYQSPLPPMWVTTSTPSNAAEIAARGRKCATFLTGFEGGKAVFDAYRSTIAARGETATPDQLGYACLVAVGNTEAEGRARGEEIAWYLRGNKVASQFNLVPGYIPAFALANMARGSANPRKRDTSLETLMTNAQLFCGTVDSVFDQIKAHHDFVGGYGHLMMMGQGGFLGHEETLDNIALIGKEIVPRLADLGVDFVDA